MDTLEADLERLHKRLVEAQDAADIKAALEAITEYLTAVRQVERAKKEEKKIDVA